VITDQNIKDAIAQVLDEGCPLHQSPWMLYSKSDKGFADGERSAFCDAVIARAKALARNDVINREGAL